MKHRSLYLLPFLILSACSEKRETNDVYKPDNIDHVINVNMTFDRNIDFPVTKIAVVPNSVAPWASSLFLIDGNNVLQRGDIERGDFKQISTNIQDITPLAREKAAGILLTKSNDGDVQGLLEINDEGDYTDIPLTKTSPNIHSFCAADRLSSQHVFAQLDKDIMRLDLISPTTNGYVTAIKLEDVSTQEGLCVVNTNGSDIVAQNVPETALAASILSSGETLFITQESQTSPRLFLQAGDQITAINITGGLTTEAPSRIDSFYVIPNSLGGVLRDGAVILADNESGRLIYISLSFLKMRLAEVARVQDNP